MTKGHPLYPVSNSWRRKLLQKVALWILLWLVFIIGWSVLVSFSILLTGIAILICLFLLVKEWRKLPLDEQVVRLVNEQFHPSQYSTELVYKENTSGLEAIQRERVIDALHQSLPTFIYPIIWKDWMITGVLLSCLLVFGGFYSRIEAGGSSALSGPLFGDSQPLNSEKSDTLYLKTASVTVSPPNYTGLKTVELQQLNILVPEQSNLTWALTFEGKPEGVWVRTSAGDSLVAKLKNDQWTVSFRPKESGFYTLNFTDSLGNNIASPYYELQLVPDEPPAIQITGIPQFQRLDYKPELSFDFGVDITDDYGLMDGYVVATITKGSGESVKFREQKVPFNQVIQGKSAKRKLTFRLDDFTMEPGNELYFYATAFDNKPLQPQGSRTETYFIILKDTAQVEFSLQGALGVDLMPDYFRSQLQIILDTEKLLREQKQLSTKEFNSQSNDLGYDQKQLRLKYGQFIGEEEDSGLDIDGAEPESESAPGENVLAEFGHDTDHENEEGAWMDRGTESDNKNPLADFMHMHDDEETASFYTQTLKDKLRAALNEMWDAELYLRLFRPKESLPYQYRAQELLKEIRNHARIYVQRIGFDPPPVNEAESRLTGKMKELNQKSFSAEIENSVDLPAIRKAVSRLDQTIISRKWDASTRQLLQEAGDELAGLAVAQPGNYLQGLNLLRNLLDQSVLDENGFQELTKMKVILASAIKENTPVPTSAQRPGDDMSSHFTEALLTPVKR